MVSYDNPYIGDKKIMCKKKKKATIKYWKQQFTLDTEAEAKLISI